jgi:transcriptional regulator with XRE-family HTH domain
MPPNTDVPRPYIREWRLYRGLSQRELAERAGITRAAIQTIERLPDRRPRPSTLRKFAEVLEVATGDLYRNPFDDVEPRQ